jgi:lincosamide nucleotidyltransferase A/C/D/E
MPAIQDAMWRVPDAILGRSRSGKLSLSGASLQCCREDRSVGTRRIERVESADVVRVLTAMNEADVDVWVDGGWGVDALVGRESRRHKDLDLLVLVVDVQRAAAVLVELGFGHLAGPSPAGLYCDVADRRVDISVVAPDGASREYVHETSHDTPRLAVEDLSGQGMIGGLRVRCLTASAQVRAHVGYEMTDKDEHDLQLLRGDESDRRFGHT